MKILWATNTPALAEEIINKQNVRGGWIKSLQMELMKRPDVKLGIVFLGEKNYSFEIDGCQYYIIKRKRSSRFKRLLSRKLRISKIDLDIYRFKKIIESFNPDLVHIHGTESDFGLIQKLIKVPVAISIQGNLTICAYKYFSGISINEINKYSSLIDKILGLDLYTLGVLLKKKSEIEKKILKNAKHIIGRTDWDKRIVKVLAPKANYYHNDEILREGFYQKTWSIPDTEDFKIFTITGSNNYKGFDTLVDTAILLKKNKLKFKWYVAGITENSSLVKIVTASRNIKLVDINIILLGELEEQDIIEKMLTSNIFIQVSHLENSSNSLCEAMLLGMPIIATCAGGTSSLITDKKNGILVQDGDPYVLSGAILEAVEFRDIYIKYAKNAKENAIRRHNKNKVIDDLITIYTKIIQE